MFLALPDGQALLYSLVGTAESPLPVGRLTVDITCKTSHLETVDVTNWLTEPQRCVRGRREEPTGSHRQTTSGSAYWPGYWLKQLQVNAR